MRHFSHYLLLSHIVHDWARFRQQGLTPLAYTQDIAEELLATYKNVPGFESSRAKVHAYSDAMLMYMFEGGVISEEQVVRMKSAWAMYVPMSRIQAEIENRLMAGRGTAIAKQSQPDALKGRHSRSTGTIIDPLESLMKNTFDMVAKVENNRAAQALRRAALRAGMVSLESKAVKLEGGGAMGGADPRTVQGRGDIWESVTDQDFQFGPGAILSKVKPPLQADTINLEQVEQEIKAIFMLSMIQLGNEADASTSGLPATTPLQKKQAVKLLSGLDLNELVTVFSPARFVSDKEQLIAITENGKKEWYKVPDENLYNALVGPPAQWQNIVVRMAASVSRLLRATAVSTLEFGVRNPLRDTVQAFVASRYGFIPVVDTIRGLFDVLGDTEMHQLFMNSMAGGHSLVSADRNYLREEMRRMGLGADRTLGRGLKQYRQMSRDDRKQFRRSIPATGIDALRAMQEALENASRVGEFRRGLAVEGRSVEGLSRAAFSAAEVTVNFRRGGQAALQWNQVQAFFNAGIQGQVRLAQVFKRDPVGFMLRGGLLSTMTMAILAMNWEDEDYWELPLWDRMAHWHIRRGTDVHGLADWIRIPKPWTLGDIFANIPQAAMEFWGDSKIAEGTLGKRGERGGNREAFSNVFPGIVGVQDRRWKESIWNLLAAITPSVLMPLVEAAAGYDAFLDRDIVPRHLEGTDPEFQAHPYTSLVARRIARWTNFIPAATVDKLISGYTAGIGRDAVRLVDTGLRTITPESFPSLPRGGPAQAPGLRALYTTQFTTGGSGSIETYYRLRDRGERAMQDFVRAKNRGDEAAAERRMEEFEANNPDAFALMNKIQAAESDMRDLRGVMNDVMGSMELDADIKARMRKTITGATTDRARKALGLSAIYGNLYSRRQWSRGEIPNAIWDDFDTVVLRATR